MLKGDKLMNIYQSKQWIEDIDEVISTLPELLTLHNKSIMITGAAGLICSSIVDILIRYNETHKEKIKIIAAGRWLEEMTNRFHEYTSKDYFEFIKYDASTHHNQLTIPCDYIIHGASNQLS